MKRYLSPTVAVLLLTALVWLVINRGPAAIPLTIGGETLYVELAETEDEWSLGLGGRKSMKEGRGMLYVFPKPHFYVFNMKDMLFPLDIIWINKDKKIVDVMTNVGPETYPEFSYVNDFLAQYVLEVNAGFFDAHGVQIGDIVEFSLEDTEEERD